MGIRKVAALKNLGFDVDEDTIGDFNKEMQWDGCASLCSQPTDVPIRAASATINPMFQVCSPGRCGTPLCFRIAADAVLPNAPSYGSVMLVNKRVAH